MRLFSREVREHIVVRGSVRDAFKGMAANYTGGTASVREMGITECGVEPNCTYRDEEVCVILLDFPLKISI